MTEWRSRDVWSLPSALSLARLPLAAVFPLAANEIVAVTLLVAAAATDVLDGWCARRLGRVTFTGTLLDPLMDKLFVVGVVTSLTLGAAVVGAPSRNLMALLAALLGLVAAARYVRRAMSEHRLHAA
jgi:phosphatidylglycerophosphate synthase